MLSLKLLLLSPLFLLTFHCGKVSGGEAKYPVYYREEGVKESEGAEEESVSDQWWNPYLYQERFEHIPGPHGAEGGYDGYGGPPPGINYGGPGYGPPGGLPPYGYQDPGFQSQTGFEGLLVPNTWYGLLPWGIEGVVIVIAGIIVFAIIVIAIVALLTWLCGIKAVMPFTLPLLHRDDSSDELTSRYMDEWINFDSVMDLSANVLDAIEKYNHIPSRSITDENQKKLR